MNRTSVLRSLPASALALAIAATALLAPAGATGRDAEASSRRVGVYDNYFSPDSITVASGTTVRWVWKNTFNRHDVRVKSGPEKFRSKKRKGKYTYTKKLTKKGVYQLYCSVHPTYHKMTVTVN